MKFCDLFLLPSLSNENIGTSFLVIDKKVMVFEVWHVYIKWIGISISISNDGYPIVLSSLVSQVT